VCDAETKFEIETFSVAADNRGTLHLLYKTGEGGSLRDVQCAYARIQPMTSEETSGSRQIYRSDLLEVSCTLAKLTGQVFASERMGKLLECHDIAVDPETGTALIIIKKYSGYPPQPYSYVIEDGKIVRQVKMYDFDGEIHVEPAGKGSFHAVGVWWDQASTRFIYYLEYHDGMWSAPVELGKGWLHNVEFVSDLNRRAFALWTDKNYKPVARWIER